MNNKRRGELAKLGRQVSEAGTELSRIAVEVREAIEEGVKKAQAAIDAMTVDWNDLAGQAESLRDEEQEYYDNMPEGLQGSERGETAQEAANQLDAAKDKLEEIATWFEELDLDELFSEKLDELDTHADSNLGEVEGAIEEAQA